MGEPRLGFVLFVDDDADTRELAQVVLSGAGLRCRAASRADEALTAAAVMRFDVVVLDLGLPGPISGLELARRLARSENPPPIVIQTGHPREQVPADVAVAAYLRKPYTPEDLLRVVTRLLRANPPDRRRRRGR